MKTIFFFFLFMALWATGSATQRTTALIPDPFSSVGSQQGAVSSNPLAGSVQPAGEVAPPVYYTGNNEIATSSGSSGSQLAAGSENTADSLQQAIIPLSFREGSERGLAPAVLYYNGNDEPILPAGMVSGGTNE
jgi:hypothetical protein